MSHNMAYQNVKRCVSDSELDAVMDLWDRLAGMFPGTWRLSGMPPNVREAACEEWALGLRKFDGEAVIAALTAIRNQGLKYAPDLPLFLDYCKGAKSEVERPRAEYPQIPAGTGIGGYVSHVLAPNARSPIAKQEMAKIQQILHRRGRPLCVDDPEGFDAMFAEHERLVSKVPRRALHAEICHHAGCSRPGTLSHSTTGGGPWWCRDHFRG